ncbi:hypothetical protein AgCh_009103 [Apium graveolens]
MAMKCYCDKWVVERTARTQINAGRRFLGCVDGYNGCGFFMWVDAPFVNRSLGVINGLLRRIRDNEEQECSNKKRLKLMEEEVAMWKKETRKWKLISLVLALLLFVFWCKRNGHVDLEHDM